MSREISSVAKRTRHRIAALAAGLVAVLTVGLATTSCTGEQTVDDEVPTEQVETEPTGEPEAVEGGEVIASPEQFQNQHVDFEATVQRVISDKAFYVGESKDERLYTALHMPDESRADIEAGQRVRVEGVVVSRDTAISRLNQLDEPAPDKLFQQDYALLISEADNIEILEQAPAPQAMREGKQKGKKGERGDDEVAERPDSEQQAETGDQTEQQQRQAEAETGGQGTDQPVTIDEQQYGTFGDWDTDGDQMVTRKEFQQGVTDQGVYDDLDTDNDNQVSEDELKNWVFGVWDADNDGNLTEEEYEERTEQFDEYEWGEFDEWNTDGDALLTDTEFMTGEAGSDLFDEWDADDTNFIDDNEFGEGLFDIWNADDDKGLTPDEIGFGRPESEVSAK